MPALLPKLADPPAEDLDSLEPVRQHSSGWRPRRLRNPVHRDPREYASAGQPRSGGAPRGRNKQPGTATEMAIAMSEVALLGEGNAALSSAAGTIESRLGQLEEIVRDCAVLLRSSVFRRLDKLESGLATETARLDERLHAEARRRCRLLTEVTVKVSAAIDQLRLEAKSAPT